MMIYSKAIEKRLKTAQIGSAVAFLPVLFIHLINAVLGILGPSSYDRFQKAAQQFYQLPIIELLFVIGPLLIHMLAGLALQFINRRHSRRLSARQRLHRWAGVFLALVILGHVAE